MRWDCPEQKIMQIPRIFFVKLHRTDVVKVADQVEETSLELIVPHFDLVVVTSRHKQGLRAVKANTAHRSLVLFELVDHDLHAVVPQLEAAIVQRSQNPRPPWVESQALDAVALVFKLDEHFFVSAPLGIHFVHHYLVQLRCPCLMVAINTVRDAC